MKYNTSNLEIFIMTYNRKHMLEESLKSLLNQTVKGFKIIISDNASDDGTEEVIKKYQTKYGNIIYHRNETNIHYFNNLKKQVNFAQAEYVMFFHDDDILHPEYIETALNYLNKYPDIAVFSSYYKPAESVNNENWQRISTKAVYCKNREELAALMYCGKPVCFPSTIYKTSHLKNFNFDYKLYGKMADKPLILEIAKNGPSIVLTDKYLVRYRVHKGQDTKASNGPFSEEIINLNKLFLSILGNSIFNQYGRVFVARNFKWLKNGYGWGKISDYTLEELCKIAIGEQAATKGSILFGKLRHNIIFNIFRGLFYLFLRKNYKYVNL